MTDTASRLLKLLSLLQARRDWPGVELASRLEVSARTIRRDVERLRALGYPVTSLPGPAGGYRLGSGAAMPPLLVDDDEAIAIAVGLRTAARAAVDGIEDASLRALVKLEQVLPSHLRRRVSALGTAAVSPPGGGPTVDPQALTTIAAACRDRERIRFAYRDRDGAESRREAEPHGLVNVGRRWYLAAWDRGRDGWRTFRVDRIREPAPTAVRFPARELPGGNAVSYVEASLSSTPHRYNARVILAAPAERVRGSFAGGWGTIEAIDDGRCEYRNGDDDLDWLALRIAMLGVDFEVVEPPELGDHLRALAERIARAAASATGGILPPP